jgi:hypothetical protein
LSHTVNFATRTQNESSTATDNIFVANSRLQSPSTSPLINGLSDHDAQLLTVNNIYTTTNKIPLKQRIRLINNETITNFQTLLKKETWESVYRDNDTNYMFNSFLCTFLNIFQASFPIKYKSSNNKKKMTGLHKE